MAAVTQPYIPSAPRALSLFDANSVAAATLLGTPAAGAALMAWNYRRLGHGGKAVFTLFIGVLVTALVILITWQLPRSVTAPIGLVLLVATRYLAQGLQSKTISEQVQQGARLGSKGIAFAIGAAFFVALFGMAYAAESLSQSKVIIGAKDEVYYSGTATKDEALVLGNRLKEIGYLTDRGVTVFLDKTADRKTLSFVIKEGAWNNPQTVGNFDEIGREMAPAMGGFPVTVRLLDKERDVKSESVVGKVDVNAHDTIYYSGTATAAQAQALGKALQADQFFTGKGSDVFFAKHDGTTMSFIVKDGVWDKPASVRGFENTVRETAQSVGGLPIRLHLLNTSLKVEKEAVVN